MSVLLLRNGRIVDPANELDIVADVLVADAEIYSIGAVQGQFYQLAKRPGSVRVIDATGKLVCPGLIDIHVHLREPGFEHKETIATGTRAALAGGFTAVCPMPNTNPPPDTPERVADLRRRIEEDAVCHVYPIGAATRDMAGEELTDYAAVKHAGCIAISDDAFPIQDDKLLLQALEQCAAHDLPFMIHCEKYLDAKGGVMNAGPTAQKLGVPGIPRDREIASFHLATHAAASVGARLHVLHVSTRDIVIAAAVAGRLPSLISLEASPHHFILTDEAVERFGPDAKVNPPLRTKSDVEAIKKALADNLIEVISTDHAPHTLEEKFGPSVPASPHPRAPAAWGVDQLRAAPFGFVGLELAVPLVMTFLVQPGVLTLSEAIAKLTCNPASVLSLPGGTLTPGSPADITIIDPNAEREVNPDGFYSKGRNTPFAGQRLKGWPWMTIVGGVIKMKGGDLTET